MVHARAALPIREPDDDIDEFAARDRRRVADDRDETAPPARLQLPEYRRPRLALPTYIALRSPTEARPRRLGVETLNAKLRTWWVAGWSRSSNSTSFSSSVAKKWRRFCAHCRFENEIVRIAESSGEGF